MNWTVVREIGVEYASPAERANTGPLKYPVSVAQAGDGTYLIVDELCAEKPVPFRMEYRTLRVSPEGVVLFDTARRGIDDGYGCLWDQDGIAILRRTQWKLLLFSLRGDFVDELDLTRCSKRLPRHVSWTTRRSFLLAFLDRPGKWDIVEIDSTGNLLWQLPNGAPNMGVPASLQLTAANTVLIADAFHHVIWEYDRSGRLVWQFGAPGSPAAVPDRVSGPCAVRELADGRRIVSDTRNHRILLVERSGAATRIGPEETELSDPMFADLSLCGNLLVCDSGNSRVIELEEGQRPVWQFGSTLRSKRYFSFPRSVELAGPARYLVADTANDRIVEASSNTCPQSLDCREAGLFWPRCVRRSPSGTLVIADGRRGRIIELRQEGHILRQLEAIQSGGGKAFVDPHDVRLLPGDHLLVTDSPNGLVVECDWEGKPYRVIGDRDAISLDDPHSAQKLDDGRIAICDSGNHRILVVGAQGQTIESIETIRGDDAICKLNLPRYAEVSDDGTLLIVDTGNNRVLATDLEGQLRWVISEVGGSPIAQLHQPRWATLVGPNEVVIADHFHHRVIHVRRAD